MFACQDDASGRLPLGANGPFRLRSSGFELGDVLCPVILRFRQSAENSDCEIPTAYKDTRGRTLVGASRASRPGVSPPGILPAVWRPRACGRLAAGAVMCRRN